MIYRADFLRFNITLRARHYILPVYFEVMQPTGNIDSTFEETELDLSQHALHVLSQNQPDGPIDSQYSSSVWMRELHSLLPILTPKQQSTLFEFAFWSPTGVWDDFLLPGSENTLHELEKRHLIERTYDPFIVDRPGHSMWRITGGGHDTDRLFHYHIQRLAEGETSRIFQSVFARVIRHFSRCVGGGSDCSNQKSSSLPNQKRSTVKWQGHYPVEMWECLPHAARLIRIVNEADFHDTLLGGQGDDAVRMMIEVVWLTSCIETMDELLAEEGREFSQTTMCAEEGEGEGIVSSLSSSHHYTTFIDPITAVL